MNPKKSFTFNLTPYQHKLVGRFVGRKLARAVWTFQPPLTANLAPIPAEHRDELRTCNVGSKLEAHIYDALQKIAQDNNLSMSKAAIRLLQLPE